MNIVSTSSSSNLIGKLIADGQTALNLSDEELAKLIGYEKGVVVAMMKTGAMRLPLTKVPALAAAFDIEPAELLVTVIRETGPDLMKLIEQVWPRDLTPEEGRLIQACRRLASGRKVAPIIFADKVIALITV